MNPKTASIAAPRKDAPNVSRYEAMTRAEVTVETNRPQCIVDVFRKIALSGISTTRLR
jgi:hypothetical protein